MRLSSMCTFVSPLEYEEANGDPAGLPLTSSASAAEPSPPVVIGVPEDEVERRIQVARDAANAEAERRVRSESEHANERAQGKVTEVLREFSRDRADYFRKVEGEIVQLALSIARKIIQRETELDPTLLTALVRIALDRMQCNSVVRIRVPAENAKLWRKFGGGSGGSQPWEIFPDDTLSPGDCIVETELGAADFGFEAQLRDVEETFAQLLSHRPDASSRHAAGA